MKAPKEILLKRHEAAATKLDAIREIVMAEHLAASAAPRRNFGPAAIALKLWAELVWPCRRIWAGMAVVWVAVVFLGFASAEKETVVRENASAPTADVVLVLKEQRQMMAQLLESAPAPMDRARVPGPRSEVRSVVMMG